MGTFLKPPERESRVVKVTRRQKLVALEQYEKLTDEEFDELYHDIQAEASRRNAERA